MDRYVAYCIGSITIYKIFISNTMSNTELLIYADSALQRALGTVRHIDTKANFLLGISSILFAYTYSNLSGGKVFLPLIILNVSSGLSILFSLLAVQPPHFMSDKGQEHGITFPGRISGFASSGEYAKIFIKSATNEKNMIEEYSKDIFNLSRFHFVLKYKFFSISRSILFTGVIASMILYCVI